MNRYKGIANINGELWITNQTGFETLRQIEKDFALQAIPIDLRSFEGSHETFLCHFTRVLDTMQLIHHPRFISVLYQIDLREKDISERLKNSTTDKIYSELAHAITERCFEKVCWRQKMKDF